MPAALWWRGVCRAFQAVLFGASLILPWPRPQLLKGPGAILKVPAFVKRKNLKRPLIVTDASVMKLGLLDGLLEGLKKEGIQVSIYQDVTPNPTVDQIEEALLVYNTNQCDHLIAVGGGSAIDCAKVVGARHVRPRTPIHRLRGLFRVMWKLPPLVAVPTTAGTGSECTLAAVVTNPRTHEKYPLTDFFLFPPYAVLDPLLTVGLPKFMTATTGMDALTHAVEAFTNLSNVKQTEADAIATVRLVFANLKEAYDHPDNITARENMQEAAYLGGLAFTRAYVGNIHGAAHQLGGFYNIPHGYANAVIMPHVLDMYGSAVYHRLAVLADAAGVAKPEDSNEVKSKKFIQAIRDLNASMRIPTGFSKGDTLYKIKEEDLPILVKHALQEVNPLYAVPVIFGDEEMEQVFRSVM